MNESHGTPEDERLFHSRIANSCKFGIVEIGIMNGETTELLLRNSNVQVYGIDPIIPDSMDSSYIGNIEIIESIKSNFDRFTFIKDYSYNAVKEWIHDFDYIFVDGSHFYEDVKKDFDDWFPLLKSNGYISFHDSAVNRKGPYHWPGPSNFVDSIMNDDRLEYIDTIYSLTIFKKL